MCENDYTQKAQFYSLKTKFSSSTNRSTCLHIHRPFQWLINSNARAGRMRFVSLYVYACRLVGATHLSCDITTEYHRLIQTVRLQIITTTNNSSVYNNNNNQYPTFARQVLLGKKIYLKRKKNDGLFILLLFFFASFYSVIPANTNVTSSTHLYTHCVDVK